MKLPVTLTRRLIAVAALALLTACGGSDTPPAVAGADYGVVAAPPLPVNTPFVGFDPTASIANVDGRVIVDLVDGTVIFRGPKGPILSSTAVTKESELRAVSADGMQAAMYEPLAGSSRITVVDRVARLKESGEAGVQQFELDGLVEPEAFSTDGTVLYVIDHQIAAVPGAYRVRPLNLVTGELETILGPTKIPFAEDMNGNARRQIWSPGGSRLNTLYIRQTHHHHDDGEHHAHGEPATDGFIHVLDLDEEWAFCLDLPEQFGAGDLETTALAVSPDGATLAVADVSAGQIAFASAEDLAVTRVVTLPDFDFGEDLQLGMARGSVILGSGSTVQWFDADTMEPQGDPVELESSVVGFTSSGVSAMAWTTDSANGPVTLRAPSPTNP